MSRSDTGKFLGRRGGAPRHRRSGVRPGYPRQEDGGLRLRAGDGDEDIHRRVRYMTWVQRRLDLDHVTLDVDMGAQMFFTDWRILDIAGLVDVPMARHKDWNKKFMRQYVFEEARPEFAHVHSGWARRPRS